MFSKPYLLLFLFFFISLNFTYSQTDTSFLELSIEIPKSDSVCPKEKKRYKPYFDTSYNRFRLRNEEAKFARKFRNGVFVSLGFNISISSMLFVLPESISKWDKSNYKNQFKESFTKPPVIDKDKWYINYLGHPYQGTIYYNAMRSQGAKAWQSGLFCLGNVLVWEYLLESGFEQPSIQDLVVTPAIGILLGELFHFSTIKMSKNGFKWYEKIFVSILNPAFAINNGFKYAKPKVIKSHLVN